MVQAYVSASESKESEIEYIPFPLATGDRDRLDKNLGLWKKLPPSVTHSCMANSGYISLIKLEPPKHLKDELNPQNGVMKLENAILLQEEVDKMSASGNDKTDSIPKKLSLRDPMPTVKRDYLLGINFGIPLFDSDLNKAICQRIVINNLWKQDNLDSLEKSGIELSHQLTNFINDYQDISLVGSDKIWLPPEEKRKSPVPLPSKPLFFDGTKILDIF